MGLSTAFFHSHRLLPPPWVILRSTWARESPNLPFPHEPFESREHVFTCACWVAVHGVTEFGHDQVTNANTISAGLAKYRCSVNVSWTKFQKMERSWPDFQDWSHMAHFLGSRWRQEVPASYYSHIRDLKVQGKERSRSFQLTVYLSCHLSLGLFLTLLLPRDQREVR